jgi:sulfur relay (sulfurtransferase) DsrC/TusE family protein
LKKENFPNEEEYSEEKGKIKNILDSVKNVLRSLPKEELHKFTLENVLKEADVSESNYYKALRFSGHGTGIVLRRSVNEIYINNYNKEWLAAWNENLDIQLCLDYFSVLTYITDYYSKDDTGTMDILKQCAKQCQNQSLKDQMKCLSQAFLSHRQIGESEAYYRILPNLHLTESNIKCIFLSGGFPQN